MNIPVQIKYTRRINYMLHMLDNMKENNKKCLTIKKTNKKKKLRMYVSFLQLIIKFL